MNPIFDMQEKYMKELEDQYDFMQNEKKARKFQIVRSITKLQKFWRFYYRMKKRIAANKIGSWYRERRYQISDFRDKMKELRQI